MYLDPGLGSLIIQIILAIIASFGAFLYFVKNKVKKTLPHLDKGKNEKLTEVSNDSFNEKSAANKINSKDIFDKWK